MRVHPDGQNACCGRLPRGALCSYATDGGRGGPHEPARPIQSGQERPSSDCVIARAPHTSPLGRGTIRSGCHSQ